MPCQDTHAFQDVRASRMCVHAMATEPHCSRPPPPQPDRKTEKIRREVLAAGGTWRDVARMPEAGAG